MAIKLVENYAVTLARQSMRDSLMSHGEECIALRMYHVNEDEGKAARCPQCYDDMYKQSNAINCSDCYGTTFAGGVKSAVRVWGMFTDQAVAEQIGAKGVWQPDQRDMQVEPFPLLTEHDYVVRVRLWDSSHKALEVEGYYAIQQVTRNSLRTGNRFGQWQWDIVGQKATVTELQKNSPICSYSTLGIQFPDAYSVLSGASTPVVQPSLSAAFGQAQSTSSVVQPDHKIVFFPVGELLPEGVFVFEQTIPSDQWIITHSLGHTPSVHVTINGEEVDADIIYPNSTTVLVQFAEPQVGRVEMV
jgi:hypothetical protein